MMQQGVVQATVETVSGPVPAQGLGVVDAHNHLWIDHVGAVTPDAPVLDDFSAISAEVREFAEAGGKTIIDCQPGGTGRDGRMLQRLSQVTQVNIVASTGFHLQRYYNETDRFFHTDAGSAQQHFLGELNEGLVEALAVGHQVRAGLIKIACEQSLDQSPRGLIGAAVAAAVESGTAVQVHTEKGADAARIVAFILGKGLSADQLILCHMDKRPDLKLHIELCAEGIALEYDTFYRPNYLPKEHVWPLMDAMITAGLQDSIILATDMAQSSLWRHLGEGPGLVGLLTRIIPHMEERGYPPAVIRRLTGENIAERLSRYHPAQGG